MSRRASAAALVLKSAENMEDPTGGVGVAVRVDAREAESERGTEQVVPQEWLTKENIQKIRDAAKVADVGRWNVFLDENGNREWVRAE